ncbi:uncharacterized protein METZ01_LOCUS30142 [marine metagenome]|uniref:Uncharacterized protein n=1 Tax=marine metagenome TaxID=408172 RepID=A0A381QE91_9ZZZZ
MTLIRSELKTFRSSSVVEQSAVNRSVAGSNPACGANYPRYVLKSKPTNHLKY